MRRLTLSSIGWLAACALLAAQAPAPSITLPNRPGAVRFAAIGDNGTGERPQYQVAEQMVLARQGFAYDFVIMLGDNIYGRQTPADFARKFERPYQPLLDAGVRFYASLGNHDEPASRSYPPWNMNGQRYYTFVKGPVRFFALDSNTIDPAQVEWLSAQLRASSEDWKIVFFHHPLYSSAGRHGSARDMQASLEPLFVRHGVDAVFSGHDHVYERIAPQKGIYYFVAGSAGKLRRGDLRRTPITAAGYDQDQAFLLVEIDEDAMSVQAITRTGRTVDTATLPQLKGAAAATPTGRR